jgi:hypothetical protein
VPNVPATELHQIATVHTQGQHAHFGADTEADRVA